MFMAERKKVQLIIQINPPHLLANSWSGWEIGQTESFDPNKTIKKKTLSISYYHSNKVFRFFKSFNRSRSQFCWCIMSRCIVFWGQIWTFQCDRPISLVVLPSLTLKWQSIRSWDPIRPPSSCQSWFRICMTLRYGEDSFPSLIFYLPPEIVGGAYCHGRGVYLPGVTLCLVTIVTVNVYNSIICI